MTENNPLLKTIFGRLTLESFPIHEPILVGTFIMVAIGGATVLGLITRYKLWGYLWKEWFTTVDHKRIGIMYMILGLIMFLRGFADAIMMRAQQALAFNGSEGYLNAHHYDQVFTAHGVIMIFFVAMPMVTGLMNYIVPLQIGARDVSFPFLNNFSFWMTVGGAVTVMMSLFVGEFARTGWLAYPPLSGIAYSPDVGMDYYIWGLQIAGVGTLLSGVNLIVTIVKMRAPGMSMMKMPVFTWTSLCTNVLIVAAFPVLTAVLVLLSLDRYIGTAFFTNDFGGNPMMYVNLIWIWGHPEVYILILPAFGIFSEITSTFSGKRLFGYTSMVYATVVITILSYLVWLHHFFTMGSGASVNSFFGITTMVISIPTGAKIFNWLFTMYRGRIRFELPMMWTVAFMLTFTVGGMTGVLLAVPPADFVLHNSLFLIAHFHNVIIGGVLFGLFAGINYWWPKAFGFKLDETWGKRSFWLWAVGFWFAFMPLYVLGLMGVTRRMRVFDDPSLQIWFVIAGLGAAMIAAGIGCMLMQFYVSIRDRAKLRDTTGDPWNGRTLEWATSSPPPDYNFAFTPIIHDGDAWADMKKRGYERPLDGYRAIHMPSNTGAGIILAGLSVAFGVGMIWWMWWLAGISFVGLIAVAIGHTFNYKRDFHIPVEDVVRVEGERTKLLAAQGLILMSTEATAPTGANPVFYVKDEHDHPAGGSTMLGFWIYLMSDCLIFAVLFATYAVLGGNFAGGPGPRDLFELPLIAVNTAMLLFSSITYGFAMLATEKHKKGATIAWLLVTGLFGLAFLGIELYEFSHLIHEGAGPQRSAFLSAFFTLVGTHGLHVTFGLIWLVTLVVQIGQHGLIAANKRRLMCLSLFWHFLDVIWIGVFTFVYLMGMLR